MIKVPDIRRHVFIFRRMCNRLLAIFRHLKCKQSCKVIVIVSFVTWRWSREHLLLPCSSTSSWSSVLFGTMNLTRRAAIKKSCNGAFVKIQFAMSQVSERAIKKLIINWKHSRGATAKEWKNFYDCKKVFKKLIKFELYCHAIKLEITIPDFLWSN